MPGEHHDDVTAHLRAALGDLFDKVDVEVIMDDPASISRVDSALWDSLERSLAKPFPTARPTPQMIVGFTDARIYRNMGAVAYGAGLFSPDVDPADFGRALPRQRRADRRRVVAAHDAAVARRRRTTCLG